MSRGNRSNKLLTSVGTGTNKRCEGREGDGGGDG